jgi:hypothetical protein
VHKNAMITMRLLLYMQLAVAGTEPRLTLADAWTHTLGGNAVFDVLYGNRMLAEFGHMTTPRGQTVLTDFMTHASVGRIRRGHSYADTEQVLCEMAEEMGIGEQIVACMRQPGYVPESAFYAFTGRPDHIFLQPPETLAARIG